MNIDSLYDILVLYNGPMLSVGFKDHSYYVGVTTSKAMYVVEYLEDIPKRKIALWNESCKALSKHKDITDFSVQVLDQASFANTYEPIVKSYGLGTSFSYVDKLILSAIGNINK